MRFTLYSNVGGGLADIANSNFPASIIVYHIKPVFRVEVFDEYIFLRGNILAFQAIGPLVGSLER